MKPSRTIWEVKEKPSKKECSCGSWRKHWQNHSENEWPSICVSQHCINIAEIGVIVASEGGSEFVAPLCCACSQSNALRFYRPERDLVVVGESWQCLLCAHMN